MKRAWAFGRNGRGLRSRLLGTGLVVGAISGWAIWVGIALVAIGVVLELRAGEGG